MNVPVIYYHSVGKINPQWPMNFLTLDLPFFQDQLRFISRYYTSVSLKEFWEMKTGKKKPVENAVVLTFDDGYLDNWVWGFPLLKKYDLKAAIFVSPDFVDQKNGIRPNLEDVWSGRAVLEDLNQWGFLSWDEMRAMEASGLVSIESHTMTHTKYFISDEIVGFHQPGCDCLYPVGNMYPEKKPYYISDPDFEKLIPYGFPFFKQASSVVARRVTIKQSFIDDVVQSMKDIDWGRKQDFSDLYQKIERLHAKSRKSGSIVERVESEDEYRNRVVYELKQSKDLIEKNLNKKVNFLCWPHGDNNVFAHQTALGMGYKATTLGKMSKEHLDTTRYERFGLGNVKNSRILSILKARYKLRSFMEKQPDHVVKKVYEYFRDILHRKNADDHI